MRQLTKNEMVMVLSYALVSQANEIAGLCEVTPGYTPCDSEYTEQAQFAHNVSNAMVGVCAGTIPPSEYYNLVNELSINDELGDLGDDVNEQCEVTQCAYNILLNAGIINE